MDVNDRARERWKAETDGFDRVRAVLETTREPASAADVADEALVTAKTARKHLERLVELGVVASEQDGRTTRYRRDPDAAVTRRIRTLRAEHTRAELLDGIERLREECRGYRERFGVDSPEELAVTVEPGTADERWAALSSWRTTERNLALAQAALSFDRARDRVEA